MITLKQIQDYLSSERVVSEIANTGRWSWHGTRIQEYFEDECLDDEYCNTSDKKRELKKYLSKKSLSIHNDLVSESPSMLYRAIYLKAGMEPNECDFHGVFWSSNPNTAACVQSDADEVEWLLEIVFDHQIVDWDETLRSRIDYIHGDRESEYQLYKNQSVYLVSKTIV